MWTIFVNKKIRRAGQVRFETLMALVFAVILAIVLAINVIYYILKHFEPIGK